MWKNIPVREEYWEQLREGAQSQGRSISNYLEQQLLEKKIVRKQVASAVAESEAKAH